jgi:hypothetical protein
MAWSRKVTDGALRDCANIVSPGYSLPYDQQQTIPAPRGSNVARVWVSHFQ